MTAGSGTAVPGEWWDAVAGRRFVDALNEGLTRAVLSTRPRAASPHTGTQPPRPPRLSAPSASLDPLDPFARAVLTAYADALTASLPAGRRHDRTLRDLLLRQARRVVSEALALAGRPVPPGALRAADVLPPEQEARVHALLMECAALLVLEGREFPGDACRPADFVKALGRCARHSPTR